jgi:predicted PurR-regulated permease PerM
MNPDRHEASAGRTMKPDIQPKAVNLIGLAAALAILRYFRSILWPFAAACVITALIFALVGRIVRVFPRAPRWSVLLGAAAIVAVLLITAASGAAVGAEHVGRELPQVGARIDVLLAETSAAFHLKAALSVRALVERVDLPALASWLLSSINQLGSGLVLMLLFLTFLLGSRHVAETKLRLALPLEASERLLAILNRTVRAIEAYVWTQGLYGLIVGGAAAVIMSIVGLHDTLFWMFAIFVLAFVPVIGVAVGSLLPALLALVQFPTVGPALVIAVGVQAVAFIAGNLVLPRIIARSVNVDPLASLLALGVWGLLWGAPGALLALPMTLILMFQCAQFPQVRWIAIFISSDGRPLPELEAQVAPTKAAGSS